MASTIYIEEYGHIASDTAGHAVQDADTGLINQQSIALSSASQRTLVDFDDRTKFIVLHSDVGVQFELGDSAVVATASSAIIKGGRRRKVGVGNDKRIAVINNSSIAPTGNFAIDVNLGLVPGISSLGVVSQNNNIGTSFQDMWLAEGALTYATANETWEIVSGSANDTSAGSGAQAVLVPYLDDDHVEQTEIVALNGTTPVTLSGADHFRLQPGFVLATVGSGGVAAGEITLRVASAGEIRGVIPAGNTGGFGSHYTVPAGKTALLTQTTLITPKNEDITTQLRFQNAGTGPFFIGGNAPTYQNATQFPFQAMLFLPEKSEFKFEAISTNVDSITGTAIAEFFVFNEVLTGGVGGLMV